MKRDALNDDDYDEVCRVIGDAVIVCCRSAGMTPAVAKSTTCLNVYVSSAPTVNAMSSGCWIMLSG